MKLRIRETGKVIDELEFRNMNSTIYFPPEAIDETTLNKFGVDYLYDGEQATGGNVYQFSQLAGTEKLSDGKWYTKYVLGPIFTGKSAYYSANNVLMPAVTAAEQEAEYKARMDNIRATEIRRQRDEMLKESDWTQMSDSTTDKAAWATYRQALRDIPAQTGFPWVIDWPEHIASN